MDCCQLSPSACVTCQPEVLGAWLFLATEPRNASTALPSFGLSLSAPGAVLCLLATPITASITLPSRLDELPCELLHMVNNCGTASCCWFGLRAQTTIVCCPFCRCRTSLGRTRSELHCCSAWWSAHTLLIDGCFFVQALRQILVLDRWLRLALSLLPWRLRGRAMCLHQLPCLHVVTE